jgi:hypothetical protein
VSHDEAEHVEVDDGNETKLFLLNRAQQEAEYELEAIELTTDVIHEHEGLEGGFISFDQHALMLSTIERLIDVV